MIRIQQSIIDQAIDQWSS